MVNGRTRQGVVLPPPVGTILLYAADGLSSRRNDLTPAGKPRTPSRSHWVPMFRQLVDSDEGLLTLHDLADAGMRAWLCPSTIVTCLDDAFRDITFRALSIAALQHFADTAREKVTLSGPEKPRQHTPPEKPRPRPERQPRASHTVTSPHRPHLRSGDRHPAPH